MFLAHRHVLPLGLLLTLSALGCSSETDAKDGAGGASASASTTGSAGGAGGDTGEGGTTSSGTTTSSGGGGAAPLDPPYESVDDPPPAPLPCTKHVGDGSGTITITQADLGLVAGDVVCIKQGEYDGFDFSSITGSASKPITIQNDGPVRIKGLSGMSGLKHVVVSGAGAGATLERNGIYFEDLSYRAIHMLGAFEDVTLQYIDFTNVPDYVISFRQEYDVDDLVYDGTDETFLLKDIRLLHLRGKNTGMFIGLPGTIQGEFPAGLEDTDDKGTRTLVNMTRNIEIAYSSVADSPYSGTVVYLGGVVAANVHHNRLSNLSMQLAQHTGIIFLKGSGHIHHNYTRGFLGNAIRIWPYGVGERGKVDIDNNIYLESSKYSPIEVQPFKDMVNASSLTHSVDVRIFNNTAGNINLGEDLPDNYGKWTAGILDAYSEMGSTVSMTNNLAFNIVDPKYFEEPTLENYMFNGMGGSPTLKNNLYYATWQGAGLSDEKSGVLTAGSPAIDAGAAIPGLTDDYYGRARTGTPDVGAYEY